MTIKEISKGETFSVKFLGKPCTGFVESKAGDTVKAFIIGHGIVVFKVETKVNE